MNDAKYFGLDVHQATISAAILDSAGNLVMEATLETKAETILQFIRGLCGSVHVTLEDGTCAAWLRDLQTASNRELRYFERPLKEQTKRRSRLHQHCHRPSLSCG
jgi:hypothetical protein